MKIMMFGRGVISTQYGWALEKAGNEIEFKEKLDMLTLLLIHMTIRLSVLLLQKSAASGSLTGEIMQRMEGSGHATPEMAFQYLQDIIYVSIFHNKLSV